MALTIHAGRTFLICDERGDVVPGGEGGLYHEDTRHLSEWRLSLNGAETVPLTGAATDPEASVHYLVNPAVGGVVEATIGVRRRRYVGAGMHEDVILENHGDAPAALDVELRFDADFAHVFAVKRALEHAARPRRRRSRKVTVETDRDQGRAVLTYERRGTRRGAVITFSRVPDQLDRRRAKFRVELPRGARWRLCADVVAVASRSGALLEERRTCAHEGAVLRASREASRSRHALYCSPCGAVDSDDPGLVRAYDRSLRDIASLRLAGEDASAGEYLIAAGIPWFVALFGRDTLIAAYQTLPFFPELARGSLLALARHQGRAVDPVSGEEPGKILHEHRVGDLAGARRLIPKFPYYGTVDATPLFVIVLHEYFQWTGDRDLLARLAEPLRRALAWLDEWGDRDGDGYLEYLREGRTGLANQGWKDSHDSVRFRDGRIADGAIALCEVQGYAWDARRRGAALLELLGDDEGAARQRAAAADLAARFDRDFWLEERDCYAEALDGEKRPVDALTSNAGHLLWSGLCPPARAARLARTLLGESLWSGWGVRTMGASEAGYNPVSYHNGAVWPHDNSLLAAGLARYGFAEAAGRIVRGLLDAASWYPDARLPELFAGYARDPYGIPVEYPTSNRPQAWAAGAVPLFVRTLLGIEVDAARGRIVLRPFLPDGVGRLRVRDLRVGGGRLDVELVRDGDRVRARVHHEPAGVHAEQLAE